MKLTIENNALKRVKLEGETEVVIPDGVTKIAEQAFSGCESMTSVTIPDSVKIIGEGAFCYCHGLTSVVIPDGVTKIYDSAFYDCVNLTSVLIPNSVTVIGECAFNNCVSLNSVTIPDSVKSIGKDSFCNCPCLASLLLPANVVEDINAHINRLDELDELFSEELKERYDLETIFGMLMSMIGDAETHIVDDGPSMYFLADEYYLQGKSIEKILDSYDVAESFAFIGMANPDEESVKNYITLIISEQIDMFNDIWQEFDVED